MRPDSSSRRGSAGSSVVSPSRLASGSKVAPWTRVELTTTKKTIAKSCSPLPTPATTGKVASQIGVAPRSPAQPSIARSRRSSGEKAVATKAAKGRATRISTAERARLSPGDVAERAGEDEQTEQDEEADLGDPADPLVEGDDRAPGRDAGGAEGERGEVDGEEAGAVGDLGQAEGEPGDRDRRHRVDPVGRQLRPVEGDRRQPAQGEADHDADRQFERQQADHVGEPEAGLLDPFDEADHQQQGDRVVHPRLALERARQALFQGRAAQHGEDRRRVGGGDRGADDHPFEQAEAEDPVGGEPRRAGGDRGADRRHRGGGAEHRADLPPAGGQAALEEDQDEGDRAQGAGQLDVVELDPADPLRAGQHAEAEEEQQAGDADAVGEQGAEDARRRAGRRQRESARRRGHPSTDPNQPVYTFSSIIASAASSSSGEPGIGTSSARSCGRR